MEASAGSALAPDRATVVHLIDGTYELYRHFYGLRRFNKGKDQPLGAVVGVLQNVLEFFERGVTHVACAIDTSSSRSATTVARLQNRRRHRPRPARQFHPLAEALRALGVTCWSMTELEADDALATAAHLAALDRRVEKVLHRTPDKDLAQCVEGDRVVQVDRKAKTIRNASGVREKFGVDPMLIPDYLALVGDPQDGTPVSPALGPWARPAC